MSFVFNANLISNIYIPRQVLVVEFYDLVKI